MRRIKGKGPVDEAISARPFNPNIPIRISEPSEGVKLAHLHTTQPIFRGRGEVVHISDEEIGEPQFTNPEAESYLVRVS